MITTNNVHKDCVCPCTLITVSEHLMCPSVVSPCSFHTLGYCRTRLRNHSRRVWTFHTRGHCVLHSQSFVPVHFKNYTFFKVKHVCPRVSNASQAEGKKTHQSLQPDTHWKRLLLIPLAPIKELACEQTSF